MYWREISSSGIRIRSVLNRDAIQEKHGRINRGNTDADPFKKERITDIR